MEQQVGDDLIIFVVEDKVYKFYFFIFRFMRKYYEYKYIIMRNGDVNIG